MSVIDQEKDYYNQQIAEKMAEITLLKEYLESNTDPVNRKRTEKRINGLFKEAREYENKLTDLEEKTNPVVAYYLHWRKKMQNINFQEIKRTKKFAILFRATLNIDLKTLIKTR